MSRDFRESDWKILRQLHPIALERFSQRVVDEIQAITSDASRSAPRSLCGCVRPGSAAKREMADVFDDMRRSTAFLPSSTSSPIGC